MDPETATPETAPVESPSNDDALASFLAEEETPEASDNSEEGDALEAPEPDEEAQEADDAEDSEDPAEPAEDPVYKVKVRGEEVGVPLSELLKGYSRTEDYKAKTAEVAEVKRQAATEYADKLEQSARLFEALDPVLSAVKDWTPDDWSQLAQEDPTSFVQIKAQYDQRVNALRQAAAEIGQARQQETKQREQETLGREQQALLKAMPELADQATFEAFSGKLTEYLKSNGFTDADLDTKYDHREYLIAEKARKYDELMAARKTAEAKKDAPKPEKTIRPKAPEAPRAPKRPGPTASDDERRAWVLANLDAE